MGGWSHGVGATIDSTRVFNLLANLGLRHPKDGNPPGPPWISMAGLKCLVSRAEPDPCAVIALWEKAPMAKEIHLTGVSQGVLNGIVAPVGTHSLPLLKRLCIQWI